MKKVKTIGISVAVLLVAVCIGGAFLFTQGGKEYYTKIDNDRVEKIAPHGDMNYKYVLTSYDENGETKEVTFETARILKEDAYICLDTAPIRGVVSWKEVQFEDLPTPVQGTYQ
ncbi:YxeA family protein [[Clostridium] innocuum]|nr:YxeA family protein [[Clostridium] innocuum]